MHNGLIEKETYQLNDGSVEEYTIERIGLHGSTPLYYYIYPTPVFLQITRRITNNSIHCSSKPRKIN